MCVAFWYTPCSSRASGQSWTCRRMLTCALRPDQLGHTHLLLSSQLLDC